MIYYYDTTYHSTTTYHVREREGRDTSAPNPPPRTRPRHAPIPRRHPHPSRLRRDTSGGIRIGRRNGTTGEGGAVGREIQEGRRRSRSRSRRRRVVVGAGGGGRGRWDDDGRIPPRRGVRHDDEGGRRRRLRRDDDDDDDDDRRGDGLRGRLGGDRRPLARQEAPRGRRRGR